MKSNAALMRNLFRGIWNIDFQEKGEKFDEETQFFRLDPKGLQNWFDEKKNKGEKVSFKNQVNITYA